MRKFSCGAVLCAALMPVSSFAEVEASSESLLKEIKSETVGFGRFRAGWIGGVGFSAGKSESDNKIKAVELKVGAYGMVTPIRNWLELEIGTIASAGLPLDSEEKQKPQNFSYGLNALTVYAGPVIPIYSGEKALSAGVFLGVAQKAMVSGDVSPKIQSGTKGYADVEGDTFENHLGAYLEYQNSNGQKDKGFGFVRLSVGKYDRVQKNSDTLNDSYAAITIGIKTNGFSLSK